MDESAVGLGWPRRNILVALGVGAALYFHFCFVLWPPVMDATRSSAINSALAAFRDPSRVGPKSREEFEKRTRELGSPENVRLIRCYMDVTLCPAVVQVALKRGGEDYIEEVQVNSGHVFSLREITQGHLARQFVLDAAK